MGQVAFFWLPVVRAGIAHHERLVKAAPVGQIFWLVAYIPFAGNGRTVTAGLKQTRHGDNVGCERGLVAGLAQVCARHRFAQVAMTIAVVVNSGQQHGPSGRTRCGDMKVRKTNTALSQVIQVGRGNFTTKSAHVTKAPVVRDQHHDVGPGWPGCPRRCGQG